MSISEWSTINNLTPPNTIRFFNLPQFVTCLSLGPSSFFMFERQYFCGKIGFFFSRCLSSFKFQQKSVTNAASYITYCDWMLSLSTFILWVIIVCYSHTQLITSYMNIYQISDPGHDVAYMLILHWSNLPTTQIKMMAWSTVVSQTYGRPYPCLNAYLWYCSIACHQRINRLPAI